MKSSGIPVLLASALGGIAGPTAGEARAAFIDYNEAVSGDLPQFVQASNTFGPLQAGDMLRVTGSLDGGTTGDFTGPDEQDTFQFTSVGSSTFNVLSVTPGSASSVVVFLTRITNGQSTFFNALTFTGPQSNAFGTLSAGTYRADIVPNGNIGTVSYSFGVSTAVPEPSSLALCGVAGIVGLGYSRGRRKARLA